jgi:hypothetical protein
LELRFSAPKLLHFFEHLSEHRLMIELYSVSKEVPSGSETLAVDEASK